MLPIGVLVNASSVVVGSLAGAALGQKLPERIRTSLPAVFGFSSCLIGISLAADVVNLAPVVLSMIVGLLIGELPTSAAGSRTVCAPCRRKCIWKPAIPPIWNSSLPC